MNDRQNFLCVCNNGKQYIREVSWRIIMYLFNYDFYDHQRYWFAANLCQCFCAIPAQIFNSLNCLGFPVLYLQDPEPCWFPFCPVICSISCKKQASRTENQHYSVQVYQYNE